jgi:hypothetical protein
MGVSGSQGLLHRGRHLADEGGGRPTVAGEKPHAVVGEDDVGALGRRLGIRDHADGLDRPDGAHAFAVLGSGRRGTHSPDNRAEIMLDRPTGRHV